MSKKITTKINEEKVVFADIKSIISIAQFDYELSDENVNIDEDVRRAVMYNKVVFENMVKRLFSYQASIKNNKNTNKEKALIKLFEENVEGFDKKRLYFVDEPDENTFKFLADILDRETKIRGYSEYILYSLFNHYFDYIKN